MSQHTAIASTIIRSGFGAAIRHWTLAAIGACALGGLFPVGTASQSERAVTVAAPGELISLGVLRHIFARFSLKTSIRVQVIALEGEPDADLSLVVASGSEDSTPIMRSDSTEYVAVRHRENDDTAQLLDWLTASAGHRAIRGFTSEAGVTFEPIIAQALPDEAPTIIGDTVAGERVAMVHCSRCHVIGEANRKGGIGSTPSFGVLRTLDDWESRFAAFFILKPHGAFTQIEGVTAPFSESLPSPITPIEMTLAELEELLAYVSQVPKADLGGQLIFQ